MHLHLGLEHIAPGVVYFTAIFVFLLSAFWRPQVGIYFLVPLLPLQNLRYRLHEFFLGEKLIDFILLGVLLGLLFHQGRILLKTPLNKLLIVLVVFTYLWLWRGSLFNPLPIPVWFDDPRVSDWKNNIVVPIVLFFLVLNTIINVKRMKIILLLMCLGVLLLNRNVYRTAAARDYSSFSYQTRVDAAGLNPNTLAALEVQFCFFLLGVRAFEKKWLPKLGYLGLAALCAFCALYTFSRGGYVAFLAGFLFLGIVKERKLLVALVLLLFAWQALAPAAVRERVFMTYNAEEGLERSAASRVTLWQDAIEAFQQNPLIGRGYDTYFYLGSRLGGLRDTHNFYLKVLYETGALGLFLVLCLLWKTYQLGYNLFRSSRDPFLASLGLGLACWMVCAVITNIFGDRWNFIQIAGYMWTMVACVVRGHMIVREEAEASAAVLDQGEARNPLVSAY